jgi:hypothetical protein
MLGETLEWERVPDLERNTTSTLIITGSTEYRRMVGKISLLIEKIWDVAWGQRDHCNDFVHSPENLVSMSEIDKS